MTSIFTPLRVDQIDNNNIVMLHEPFGFHSDVLEKAGLKADIWAQEGFVFDFESVPNAIRGPLGTNKRGGAAHDIVCRKNVCPGITKSIAADVYKEIMDYCDRIDITRFSQNSHPFIPAPVVVPYVKVKDWARRWIKSNFVRYWPGDYFLKWELTSTCQEIYGFKGDPYVTVEEKIEAAIEKAEQVSADIKDIPIQAAPELAEKADKVVEGLEEAKKVESGF
jgi:hypothetical protein